MLLKLPTIVVAASAAAFCLAAPAIGGNGLSARESFAGEVQVLLLAKGILRSNVRQTLRVPTTFPLQYLVDYHPAMMTSWELVGPISIAYLER